MAVTRRSQRLRRLINFRAHNEMRSLRFIPLDAWLAWKDWVLEGEIWLAGPILAREFKLAREQELENEDD